MIPLRDDVNVSARNNCLLWTDSDQISQGLLNDSPKTSVNSPVNDIQLVNRKLDINDEQTARFLQIFIHPNEMKSVQDKSKLRFDSMA